MLLPPLLLPVPGFGVVPPLIRRYFTTLTPALSQYLDIPAVTAAGDFELELEFSTTDSSDQLLIADETTTFYSRLRSTLINVYISGVSYNFSYVTAPHDGALHRLKYQLTGTSLELLLDGVSLGVSTVTPYTGELSLRFGDSTIIHTQYFDGIIANVNFKSGWVGPGYTNPRYPLDEDRTDTVVVNANTILGADVVINGRFASNLDSWDAQANWAWDACGARNPGGVNNARLSQIFSSAIGAQLWIRVDISDASGGFVFQVREDVYNGTELYTSVLISASGVHDIFVTPTSTSTYFAIQIVNTGTVICAKSVSAKQADGYGTAVNLNDADAELFTEHKEVSPNEWRNADDSVIIPIAGT